MCPALRSTKTSANAAPGESRAVTLEVPVADLGFHDDEGRRHVEPGRFELFVGPNSDAGTKAAFEVIAD